MNLISVMWIILGSTMGLTFLIVLAIVAGRDIIMAFKRRLNPRGCDVYVANTNRNISHYYLTPKEGVFKINKLPYVTNPEKTMNYSEETKQKIKLFIASKNERLNTRIKKAEEKKKEIDTMYQSSKNDSQKFRLKAQYEHFESIIVKLKNQLRTKQENYFSEKRPAFFYIENDPIPKDFYEFYSTLDSKIVDNLVSRAKSEPPNKKQEGDISFIKTLVIGAAIAAAIAAFFAFRNQSMLVEICKAVGAACKF